MTENVNSGMTESLRQQLDGFLHEAVPNVADKVLGKVDKIIEAARQEQFERDSKAKPGVNDVDMAGFDHSYYERGYTDYEKALRRAWEERHVV